MNNKYFLKEWIKLKCSLCYHAGIVVGSVKMSWVFFGFDSENEEIKIESINRMNKSIERILEYIDKKELK